MRDCDCDTCCEMCGHLDDCVRWVLTGEVPDDARELALTADGVSVR